MRHAPKLAAALPLAALALGVAGPAPAADPPAPAEPAPIAEWIPPAGESPKPKPEEWDKASPLALVRPHPACTASALREWARISCRQLDGKDFMGVRVVGGSEEGVHIADFTVKDDKGKQVHGVHVIFPVRRGDRRVMDVHRWESGGWKSMYIVEDTEIAISELWLPGEKGPVITVD
jgi:hypothetical protein